ncbi:MAG TPA: ABC transporter substrate-binding protein [Steroidobacteraceae bacterium]
MNAFKTVTYGMATLGLICASAFSPIMAAEPQSKYDPGASDTEIKIGQTAPYSGPLSSAAEISQTESAYFTMLNESGGINGRKVTFVSLDDAYSPPKAVEQTRRLVEQDEVLAIFNQFGTPTSTAAQKYLNAKKVPQLFCGTGSSRFNDPAFPWSSSILPNYVTEGAIFGDYVVKKLKKASVAILFQNDDFGKDYVKGFKEATAGTAEVRIVKEISYEPTEPTIESQINALAASGADVFLNVTTGKATAQSIRGLANSAWRPVHLLNGRWADIGGVFKPVGAEKAVGIISTQYTKSPFDRTWDDDAAMNEYKAFMKKYRPGADVNSGRNLQGYFYGQVLAYILRKAGNNLTRQNINDIALNLRDVEFGLLLSSVKITTSPTQRNLIQDQVLMRFDGENFVPVD